MNVYFTASIVGKKNYLDKYLAIINLLKKKGHQVTADHIIDATEAKIQLATKEQRLKFHELLESWINACDFMIAETSFPSISVGYEISLALRRKKPVLILYSDGDAPALFQYHRDENVVCEKYNDKNLADILDQFSEFVEGAHDMRFTFFISPEIAGHLDKIAKDKNLPKSVYLRNLIAEDMKKSPL